ncbi:hypothetical protein [Prosthecobacter sp.]|uniref:HEAT repeat domain-containing protein n=1 Tax=Prosthecobacter sp. TaxID=1965333 RepID=UPI002ABAD742|nr:hypothetical protein [Prosthecobacter sp.]MDZ4401929.1 hypothetical protein [Prosthecobacter sp.]
MPTDREKKFSARSTATVASLLSLGGVYAIYLFGFSSNDHELTTHLDRVNSTSKASPATKERRHPIMPMAQTGDEFTSARFQLRSGQETTTLEAAQRLAAQGTPEALHELAALIAGLPPGAIREQVVRLASAISNPAAVPAALKLLQSSADAGVIRMCQEIFSKLATTETMQSILDMHDNSTDPALRDRLERTVATISNEEALPALKFVVMDTTMPTTDGMIRASAQALRQMGTAPAVDALIERLNSEQSDAAGGIIAEQIAGIRNPVAEPSLHTAARGNSKFATNVRTRVAAIGALLNHPSAETQELLGALSNDPQQEVASSAKEILSEIQRRLNK